jgi:hypothetical protein
MKKLLYTCDAYVDTARNKDLLHEFQKKQAFNRNVTVIHNSET